MSEPVIGVKLSLEGRQVHFHRLGNGPETVLLLHGFSSLAQEICAAFPFDKRFTFIAVDRSGYGLSKALPKECRGPIGQAKWLAAFLDAMGEHKCVVVTHSFASAAALWLAKMRPDLVQRLLLLAPFCRPTTPQTMPLLRLSTWPIVGSFMRLKVIPRLATILGPRAMRAALYPNPVPAYLNDFPYRHAAHADALETMADELLLFNDDMATFDGFDDVSLRLQVLIGTLDRVAVPEWHLEWLQRRHGSMELEIADGVGHAPHHAVPRQLMELIRNGSADRSDTIKRVSPAL